MSLVYLITRLPKLTLGEPAPITREHLIREARDLLQGPELVELERVAMLEEVEETVRAQHRAYEANPSATPAEVAAFVRTERHSTALDRHPGELPEWVLEPVPQHLLMRRYWLRLTQESRSEFARAYANFYVNLEEALTGLRCQREELPRAEFLEQMSGHFDASSSDVLDSSSRVIIEHYEKPNLGLGERFSWWPQLLDAVNHKDRVEGERIIHRMRFAAIEQFKGIATFSIDVVLATYFQLRIVEREAAWDHPKGLQTLEQILTVPALEEAIGAST